MRHRLMFGGRRARILTGVLVMTGILSACEGGRGSGPGPTETYRWTDQPIAFARPPGPWQAQAMSAKERRGIRFQIDYGPGGRMSVSEYVPLHERDRRRQLRKLVAEYYALESKDFRPALAACYLPRRGHASQLEAEVARAVNSHLDRASDFHRRNNRVMAGRALVEALGVLENLRYSLDEVVGAVRMDPEQFSDPENFQHVEDRGGVVAGVPALWVDYRYVGPTRSYRWREVYFLKGTHLYVAAYQGPPQHLELFEQVVQSIAFPAEEARG